MLYRFIRFIAGIALDWFYRDLAIEGRERIARTGPLLIAVNHPNQLIDAMVVLLLSPRRVRITGKATLFENPLLGALLRWYGVVPLRRVRDEAAAGQIAPPDPERNRLAFRELVDTLAEGGAVLIFPEGTSHHQPQLAPLRTGLARLALQARSERQLRGIAIQPIGLIFERKWAPRTRILARVGDPLDLDAWCAANDTSTGDGAVERLTREVDARLRALTLNFETIGEAEQVLGLARVLSGVFDSQVRPLGETAPPLGEESRIAQRIADVNAALRARAPERVADFLGRLEAFRIALDVRDISLSEIRVQPDLTSGARFAIREALLLTFVGPFAWWGRLNHWLPLTLAQAVARRTSRTPEDPAMHTILAGAALVVLAYAAQTTVVALLAGPWWALAYLLSLPLAASADMRLRDRMRHARDRIRAYFTFRREPKLREQLASELQWLRDEALELEREGLAARGERTA